MVTVRCFDSLVLVCAGSETFELQRADTGELQQRIAIDLASLSTSANVGSGKTENSKDGNGDGENKNDATTERTIVSCAVSKTGHYVAAVTSNKELGIFQPGVWKPVGPLRRLPKAPTSVAFDHDEKYVVVADKAGNVRRYEVQNQSATEDNEADELLGHLSILLDVCFSEDGSRIITADRDEKIRITRYPQTFVIENFCLGHTAFVRTIATQGNLVASGGGDACLRLWDLCTGKELAAQELDCPCGIRRLRLVPSNSRTKIIVLPEKASRLITLDYDSGSMKLSEPEALQVSESDELLDFDVDTGTGHVVAVGRSGVYDCVNSDVKLVTTSEKLLEALRNAKEYLSRDSLTKNVAFNNMEAYKQRKEERLGKKRKLSTCSNGSVPT